MATAEPQRVQVTNREGTSRNQLFPMGTGFPRRAARLPRSASRSQTTREVPELAAPARSGPPPGLNRRGQVPPPAPLLPQPRHSAAAGRGKGHFGAEWEPRGMWRRGAWRRHSLSSHRAQPPPPPPRRSAPLSCKACSGPQPRTRAHRTPLQAQRAEGGTPGEGDGGRSLPAAPAGTRAPFARKWAGAGQGRPRRRGNGEGAPFLSRPQDRRAYQNGEEGGGLQESLSGKSLAPWGLGGWRN